VVCVGYVDNLEHGIGTGYRVGSVNVVCDGYVVFPVHGNGFDYQVGWGTSRLSRGNATWPG